MAGVYCDRCKTKVILEQDGVSCSNCSAVLVTKAPPTKPKKAKAPPTKPKKAK
jgi:DNA-directed RNA polymerase subunit RPC12/RpoP